MRRHQDNDVNVTVLSVKDDLVFRDAHCLLRAYTRSGWRWRLVKSSKLGASMAFKQGASRKPAPPIRDTTSQPEVDTP